MSGRDFVTRFLGAITPEHVVIVLSALVSAMLSSRHDAEPNWLHRLGNTVAGFVTASLVGLALLEAHWAMWLSGGMAYLAGHVGNRLTNALIAAARQAEIDPLGFVRNVIRLIWSWRNPNNDK